MSDNFTDDERGGLLEEKEKLRDDQNKARSKAPLLLAQAPTTSPVTEAVTILKASGKMGIGTTALSEDLVTGITKAESRFMTIPYKLGEYFGFGGSWGPGQMGETEVLRVKENFGTEISAFAKVFSGPPASWKDKATDPNWSYFYIAAYLAIRIKDAEVFEVSDRDSTINYGIAMYHGAFIMLKSYRRTLAKRHKIKDLKTITWKMVVDEIENIEIIAPGFPLNKILAMINYVHTARGLPDVVAKKFFIYWPGLLH